MSRGCTFSPLDSASQNQVEAAVAAVTEAAGDRAAAHPQPGLSCRRRHAGAAGPSWRPGTSCFPGGVLCGLPSSWVQHQGSRVRVSRQLRFPEKAAPAPLLREARPRRSPQAGQLLPLLLSVTALEPLEAPGPLSSVDGGCVHLGVVPCLWPCFTGPLGTSSSAQACTAAPGVSPMTSRFQSSHPGRTPHRPEADVSSGQRRGGRGVRAAGRAVFSAQRAPRGLLLTSICSGAGCPLRTQLSHPPVGGDTGMIIAGAASLVFG